MTLASVLGRLQQHLAKIAKSVALIALLLVITSLFITSCSSDSQMVNPSSTASKPSNTSLFAPRPTIKQVDPPALIQQLEPWLERYAPQVQIREPKADQIFDDTTVNVVLRVQDLPIYKDELLELGPHVELLLDNQPYGSVYDLKQPIVLQDLKPGTHTIRAFATRPWHESFKNEGAYAQATFHIFAKTDENSPAAALPLLTYGAPIGTYGAEPVLLDFYLTDAPLHQIAQDNPTIADWRVRYTINGDSLTLKNWESVYIEGLQPGQNWVQLTLIDEQGNPMEGVFNNTVRLIEYDPKLNDSLTKIIRGELALASVGGIVDPYYDPPVPEVLEPPVVEDTGATPEDDGPGLEADTVIPEVIEPEAIEPEAIKPETSENLDKSSDETLVDQTAEENTGDMDESVTVPDTETTAADSLETPGITDPKAIEDVPVDTQPENKSQSVEETKSNPKVPALLDSDLTTDTEAAVEFNPELDAEPAEDEAVSVTETLDETKSEAPATDEVRPTTRKYLQRLYDYRDRSMGNR